MAAFLSHSPLTLLSHPRALLTTTRPPSRPRPRTRAHRRPIRAVHPDPAAEETSLLAANAAFYEAFRAQSLPGMMGLWLPASDQVSVAHPLRGLAVGADEVASAWAGMFALGAVVAMEVEVVRVETGRNVGWVLCRQRVESARGKETVGGERIATNIFHVYRGEWKMAHHSAAPVLLPDGPGDAPPPMEGEEGGGDGPLAA